MDLEQRLRTTYAEHLDHVDVPTGDVAAARRTGDRLRARRRAAVGLAAFAVVALGVGSALLGSGRVSLGPSGGDGHWRELPAAPLSPRAYAQTVWTGKEVLVIGGDPQPCPPNADCVAPSPSLRDGAAYDPVAGLWHSIADAPVPVGPGDRLLRVGDVVVLRHWLSQGSAWFSYDLGQDRWESIRGVPEKAGDLPSAYGGDLYVLAGRRVARYDASTRRWTLLQADPLRPRLVERRITATPLGPVVTGLDASAPSGGENPSPVIADVYDIHVDSTLGLWRRLPVTGQVANNMWSWAGTRMVDPEPYELDGGHVHNWGHPYPQGGILDPATGRWSPLPDALVDPPQGDHDAWSLAAAGGSWFAVGGQAYDDATGRVYRLERPDGAPSYGSAAAWAGGGLLAFGGAGGGGETTNRAWAWTP